jgi:hypothetical protein
MPVTALFQNKEKRILQRVTNFSVILISPILFLMRLKQLARTCFERLLHIYIEPFEFDPWNLSIKCSSDCLGLLVWQWIRVHFVWLENVAHNYCKNDCKTLLWLYVLELFGLIVNASQKHKAWSIRVGLEKMENIRYHKLESTKSYIHTIDQLW